MHGFNNHHPKDPIYYPLLAHLAHNLTIGFQLSSNLATAKPNTAKRTLSLLAREHEDPALHYH
jgi:hypothetical protein